VAILLLLPLPPMAYSFAPMFRTAATATAAITSKRTSKILSLPQSDEEGKDEKETRKDRSAVIDLALIQKLERMAFKVDCEASCRAN